MSVNDKMFEFGQEHRGLAVVAAGLLLAASSAICFLAGDASGSLLCGSILGKIDEPTDTSNDDVIEAEVISVE